MERTKKKRRTGKGIYIQEFGGEEKTNLKWTSFTPHHYSGRGRRGRKLNLHRPYRRGGRTENLSLQTEIRRESRIGNWRAGGNKMEVQCDSF